MRFQVGDYAIFNKTIEDKDVLTFAKLSNDYNPIHFEDHAAQKQGYKKRIVHGMLIGSLFSKMIGTQLPGDGSVYVSQRLEFRRPIYVGDSVELRVTVESIEGDNKYVLSTQCYNAEKKVVVDGEAVVLVREV